MFSPIVATRWVSSSATVRPVPGNWAALRASTSSPASRASFATVSTKSWKVSLRATKSVSAFTSTMAALFGAEATPISPSAATRPDFLAAAERPFLRSQSMPPSRSPLVSVSARLQSIMPAPVFSRSSLTSAAVISAMEFTPVIPPGCADPGGCVQRNLGVAVRPSPAPSRAPGPARATGPRRPRYRGPRRPSRRRCRRARRRRRGRSRA